MVRVVQIFVIFLHPALFIFLDKKLNATLSLTKKNRLVLAGYRTVQAVAMTNPLQKLGRFANPLMSSCFATDILCTCQTKLLLVGLLVLLVKVLLQYLHVISLNPLILILEIFSRFYHNCLSCIHDCDSLSPVKVLFKNI